MVMGIAQIKLLQGRSNRNKELAAESSKTANEAIDNIRTIAALGLENEFLELYETQLLPPFRYIDTCVYSVLDYTIESVMYYTLWSIHLGLNLYGRRFRVRVDMCMQCMYKCNDYYRHVL